ncbi:hypothetical protein SAMN04487936_12220 [Halobacillus dabanensis]|uniref:Uncharacterized protein n=1 Tax=Halobacillus dabanensis TaxID=240302 RepID=A0A1I4AZ20_HALDA|nr:hypothetical protein [Halobacillus dabanensis]SFK60846.1 hypothetical protein SAMN04487936_12220 [Halobacillus dabanensis]
MDKKKFGVAAIYIIIMVPLLLVTYFANWNPSNISYELKGENLVIEEGVFMKETTEVDVGEKMDELLQFSLAVSLESKLWRTDVTVIGLLLPFLLFAVVPDRRPFRKNLPFKWYMTIVLAILVLYAAYSIPNHVSQIAEVHQNVSHLVE